MISPESKEQSLFDRANAASKDAMQSVVELARRTRTPVIVFRNGVIERIAPEMIADQDVSTRTDSKSSDTRPNTN